MGRLPLTSVTKHQRIFARIAMLVRRTTDHASEAIEDGEDLVALHAAHLVTEASKRSSVRWAR